ncbi:hypothetical protein [Candidatus Colwellia aromaticivorans]|uniref:hypothetical protein n=1 Tax=Candidatus Colwellia aromaticivorans TaxID=2267621 RepID=UPI00109B7AD4|nr:hypothetical protein [Candidatus Colwellia aromaticivorans]
MNVSTQDLEPCRWTPVPLDMQVIGIGYGIGGGSKIESVSKNDKKHTLLSALSFGMPISRSQSIKFVYIYQKSNSSIGVDSNSLTFAWSKYF